MVNWFSQLHRFRRQLVVSIAGIVVFSSLALASGRGGADSVATEVPFNGLSLKIANAKVPPGGVYQLQLLVTEPKPMGMGSSGITYAGSFFLSGIGAAIHSPSGQACGVVLPTSRGLQVTFVSPDGTFGTNSPDYPLLTIALPVRGDAYAGWQVPVGMNLSHSVFLDPSGNPYPTEVKSGVLTIGGTLNVTNVVPGGGTVPAGSKITIMGMGFTPSSVVQIDGAIVVTTQFVSSNELDITLDTAMALDGVPVRVNTGNEAVTYYSYLRASEIGQTSQSLLVAADAMFSQLSYSRASLDWTTGSKLFTGLALQNADANPAEVSLQLVSGSKVLQSLSFPLPGRSKMTRDLVEFFGRAPDSGARVIIQSTQPIQMLGIVGDSSAEVLVPVVVTPM